MDGQILLLSKLYKQLHFKELPVFYHEPNPFQFQTESQGMGSTNNIFLFARNNITQNF
jgi:hypothetical protein